MYRTWLRSVVIAGVVTAVAVRACGDFSESPAGFLVWSRRVPIGVVVASVLVVRALRRAVIVSPFGLEARRTFTSWRVPWSAVESFAFRGPLDRTRPDGPLTVVLIDGSMRWARVGARRRGQRDFAEVAAAARRRPRVRPRGYLGPNWPLLLFLLGGIALSVVCAGADAEVERLRRAAELSFMAKQHREWQDQIPVADRCALALYGFVVVGGVAAVVWSRRTRGVAPSGPWPVRLRFPDDVPGAGSRSPAGDRERPVGSLPPPQAPLSRRRPFDIPPVIVCREEGVFTAEETMLLAISHRKVTWTEIDMYTYWSARGVADFSVQVGTPPAIPSAGALSSGARWPITAWQEPLRANIEVAIDESGLVLHVADMADCRLIADQPSDQGFSYTAVDEHGRTTATIGRSWSGWMCQMSSDLPVTTRRLLCVAACWAEQRYATLHPSD